jgi:WD40 repeat protein
VRRGLGPLLIVAALVATLLLLPWQGVTSWGAMPVDPADARPSLPTEFAGLSRFTTSASSSPPGRAIAVYELGSSELFTTWQTLVAGADRDTYRRLDAAEQRGSGSGDDNLLLSPDGRRVLIYDLTTHLYLVDLATGTGRALPTVDWTSRYGQPLRLLAWSPDGRFVAYAVPSNGETATSPASDLAILDVERGTSVRYPDLTPLVAASFAPDSRRLAVQLDRAGWVVTVDGQRERRFDLPYNADLLSNVAWSPDGTRLAGREYNGNSIAGTVVFDATVSVRAAATTARADNILGWSSDSTLLARDYIDDHDAITEVSLVDGSRRTVSTFDNSHSCEYFTQTCGVYRLRLAQGLIRPVASRAPDPDRGPWLPIWRAFLALAVAAATVAVLRPGSPPRLPHLRASLGLTGQNVKFSRPIHR